MFSNYQGRLTMGAFIRDRATQFGDAELMVRGDERLTYRSAEQDSRNLAKKLVSAGVTKYSRVGIWYDNGPEWLISWLAAARIGALTILLSTYFRPPELYRTLRHADVEFLLMAPQLFDQDYQERLEAAIPELRQTTAPGPLYLPTTPALRQVWFSDANDRPWASTLGPTSVRVTDNFLFDIESEVMPSDPFVVIYTSGSTADPKGVIHSHAGVIRHSARIRDRFEGALRSDDRIYAPAPFFWVGGLVLTLMNAMHAGATVCCLPRFDPATVLEFMERERVTAYRGWPHSYKALADHPSCDQRDLSSLRTPLKQPNGATRHNTLGMTETCSLHTAGSHDAPPLSPDQVGSYGWPLEGYEHKIIDPANGSTLPEGDEGEICVRGEDLMLGMVKRDRTETFDADGYYHTGDRGFFRDGLLFFTGRMGDMIKSSGMNVAPQEVEVALEGLPEIQTAIVVGVPHADRGQDVAAVIALAPHATIMESEIISRLKERISSYKIPRRILIISGDAIPLKSSGKIDRQAISIMFDT
jgi:acyl-CoA synthetase (AMP-forming)/AMP-acid ligase II